VNNKVTICECFARDGLQHETKFVPTSWKIKILDALTDAGFTRIEATSYSHPGRVPAFRDASDVLLAIQRRPGVDYKATCPNAKAVHRAVADLEAGSGATEISMLISASESHTAQNLRTTREKQWGEIEEMVRIAAGRFKLVGVVSVAFGCPIEGTVDPGRVIDDVGKFADLGAKLVTLGDTTGLATPTRVTELFRRCSQEVPQIAPVAHFHNTRGTALANCIAALEAGCRNFDSSIGGVGGHPAKIKYGSGVTGNVATEDLVNVFESMEVDTGLDLRKLMLISRMCEEILGRDLHSTVARVGFGALPKDRMHV